MQSSGWLAGPARAAAPSPVQSSCAAFSLRSLGPLSAGRALAEEFQKSHPGAVIDVQAGGAGKGIADALAGVVDIGMVSREINPAELEKGAVALAVAKDAVVATVSRKNPVPIRDPRKGPGKALPGSDAQVRDDLGGTSARAARRRSTSSPGRTPAARRDLAAYLGGHQEDLGGIGVYGDPGPAEAVRRDPLAIGFNNVNFAYDAKTLKPVARSRDRPIDLDGNGLVDPVEKIYATRDDLTKAIAANVYPSPPARELYFVAKGKARPAGARAIPRMGPHRRPEVRGRDGLHRGRTGPDRLRPGRRPGGAEKR